MRRAGRALRRAATWRKHSLEERCMPKFRCELFGRFVFAEELSYADLLAQEARLKEDLSAFFAASGFVHLHFSSAGDFLLMQGMTAEHDQAVFREVCETVSRLLDDGVEGRLLFVDRFLDSVHFSVLNQGTWREIFLEWPLPQDAHGDGAA
jgi:hypothetical protein